MFVCVGGSCVCTVCAKESKILEKEGNVVSTPGNPERRKYFLDRAEMKMASLLFGKAKIKRHFRKC
jgi:hypothetical protein